MALNNSNEYTKKLLIAISKKMGIDLSKYNMDELIKGMAVELEHGSKSEVTDVTGDDPTDTLKIALAHLDELPDYYTRLDIMEKEGKKETGKPENEVEEVKEDVTESTSNRYKELCGVQENTAKKQLTNEFFHRTKKVITENQSERKVLEEGSFQKVEFENDGIGDDEDNLELYVMKNKPQKEKSKEDSI